ncbi:hypothetical protein EPN29_11030 [bacterium]|nr:MAG: hypothetical protein EPN29_11030 [bacterium]
MYLFLYAFRPGFLQSLNPISKFVVVVCTLIVVLRFQQLTTMLIVAVLLVLVLWFGAKVPPTEYWRLVAFFVPFFGAVVVFQGLIRDAPGSIHYQLGLIRIGQAGLLFGATLALRLLAMLLAFLSFSMTTTPPQIETALETIGVPYKAAYMVGFALRFLNLIQEEMNDMISASRIRGKSYSFWNPVSVFQLSWNLLPPMLIGVFRKSLNIALAMELRGWDGANHRTRLRLLPFLRRDVATSVASVAAATLLLVVVH